MVDGVRQISALNSALIKNEIQAGLPRPTVRRCSKLQEKSIKRDAPNASTKQKLESFGNRHPQLTIKLPFNCTCTLLFLIKPRVSSLPEDKRSPHLHLPKLKLLRTRASVRAEFIWCLTRPLTLTARQAGLTVWLRGRVLCRSSKDRQPQRQPPWLRQKAEPTVAANVCQCHQYPYESIRTRMYDGLKT
jgi:hypothetical protein